MPKNYIADFYNQMATSIIAFAKLENYIIKSDPRRVIWADKLQEFIKNQQLKKFGVPTKYIYSLNDTLTVGSCLTIAQKVNFTDRRLIDMTMDELCELHTIVKKLSFWDFGDILDSSKCNIVWNGNKWIFIDTEPASFGQIKFGHWLFLRCWFGFDRFVIRPKTHALSNFRDLLASIESDKTRESQKFQLLQKQVEKETEIAEFFDAAHVMGCCSALAIISCHLIKNCFTP